MSKICFGVQSYWNRKLQVVVNISVMASFRWSSYFNLLHQCHTYLLTEGGKEGEWSLTHWKSWKQFMPNYIHHAQSSIVYFKKSGIHFGSGLLDPISACNLCCTKKGACTVVTFMWIFFLHLAWLECIKDLVTEHLQGFIPRRIWRYCSVLNI